MGMGACVHSLECKSGRRIRMVSDSLKVVEQKPEGLGKERMMVLFIKCLEGKVSLKLQKLIGHKKVPAPTGQQRCINTTDWQ